MLKFILDGLTVKEVGSVLGERLETPGYGSIVDRNTLLCASSTMTELARALIY